MATLIGKVAVKVWPDTGHFREALRAQLEAIQRGLRDLEVGVKLDKKHRLGDQVRRAIRDAERQAGPKGLAIRIDPDSADSLDRAIRDIETRLSKLNEVEIGSPRSKTQLRQLLRELKQHRFIELTYDPTSETSMRRAVDRLDRELEKLREVKVDVDLDEDSLRQMRDSLRNVIHEGQREFLADLDRSIRDYTQTIRIDPRLDEQDRRRLMREIEDLLMRRADLQRSLTPEMDPVEYRRTLRQIEEIEDKLDELRHNEAHVRPEIDEAAYRHTQARLAWLSRMRTVRIVPLLDNRAAAGVATAIGALSGARALKTIFSDLWDWTKDLDKHLTLITALSLAISALASWGSTAISNLFALGRSLAQIGPAAMTLPGIFGGIAIGIGASVAAFKDFNKVFPDIERRLSRLREMMSDTFWKRAQNPIREMFEELFPEFSKGILQSSKDLGGWYGALADALKGRLAGSMTTMFDGLNESIRIATKSTADMARSIELLGIIGARNLPRLAEWWNRVNKQFADWLEKNEKSGQMQAWIDLALFQLGELRRALSNMGGILAGISRAAEKGGGSTLTMFADTLERVHRVVDGPIFQEAFARFLRQAHKAMSTIASLSRDSWYEFWRGFTDFSEHAFHITSDSLGRLLNGLFKGLDRPMFQRGILDFLRGINSIIRALEPALPHVADAFGALASAFGALLKAIAPALTPLLIALSNAIIALSPYLEEMVTALGMALVDAINALLPHLPTLVNLFADLMQTVADHPGIFLALGAALMAIPHIVPLVSGAFTVLQGIAALLASEFGWVAVAAGLVIGAIIGIFTTLAFTDVSGIPPLQRLKEAFEQVKIAVEDAINLIKDVLEDLREALQLTDDENSKTLRQMREAWELLGAIITLWIDTIGRHMQWGIWMWSGLWQVFGGFIATVVGIVFDYVAEKILGTMQTIYGIMQVYNGLLSGNWSMVWEGFKNVVDGAGRSTSASLTTTLDALNRLTEEKGDEIVENWDYINKEFPKKIDSARPDTVSSATQTKDAVIDVFAPGPFQNAGTEAMGGLRQGMDNGRGAVRSSAITTARSLPSHFPSSLLVGAGNGLMAGLASGIIGGIGKFVAGAISRVTAFIRENKGPIEYDRVMLKPHGMAIMHGLAEGILAGRSELRRALEKVTLDIQRHDFGTPVVAGLNLDDFRDDPAAATAGSDAKYHIEVKAETRGASATDIADEVLHAARVIEYGGLYARRSA